MTPERFQEIERLLAEALERAPADRRAFLDAECEGDSVLRGEVESLLATARLTAGFLQGDALVDAAALLAPDPSNGLAGRRLGPYRIERLVAAGGMGEVYLAHDERLDRKVALKLLDPAFADDPRWRLRFLREARLASSLDHPNVCTIHEVGEAEGRAFIAMQYVEGRTLEDLIGGRPLSAEALVPLALQVAEALAAAHERGIVHRDVKTRNVVVTPRGQAKVLDFGIAKRLDGEAAGVTQLTEAGMVLGTPASMSPEQASGGATDHRSDIFSFGVVLYEMATGKKPFAGETRFDVLMALLAQPQRPATELNPELEPAVSAVIDRALAKQATDRYPSMAALIADLRRATVDGAPEAPAGALPEPPGPRHRRRLRPMVVAAALVGAVIVGAIALSHLLPRTSVRSQVEAATSAPFQAITLRRLTTVGTASSATISPDGRYIAYATGEAVASGYQPRWPAGKASLWIQQISTGSAVRLSPPADVRYKGTAFSPDGDFVYYTLVDEHDPQGALYRVAALGGAPRRILRHIDSPVGVSPDGRKVAFIRNDAELGADLLVVAAVDGGEERVLATRRGNDWFQEYGPAWSPDGKTIACAVGSDTGGSHLMVVGVPAAGGEPRPLTDHRWANGLGGLAWSADGSSIVVIGSQDPDPSNAGANGQIWRIALPGGAVSRLTNDLDGYSATSLGLTADSRTVVAVQEDISSRIFRVDLGAAATGRAAPAKQITAGKFDGRGGLDWTPDGGIVYATRTGEHEDLWIVGADGSAPRRLTDDAAVEETPVVSRDGREVFFSSARSGLQHIWRLRLDGERAEPLTAGPAIDLEPSPSPDGTWVAFSSWRSGASALWRVLATGSDPVPLGDAPAARPMVSPDGKLVACSYFDGRAPSPQWRFAVLPAAGGEPLEVLPLSYQTVNALAGLWWTPDSRALVYVDTHDGVSNVWRQPLGGGPATQLTRFDSGQIFSLSLSRDGRRLALARGTISGDVVSITSPR